MKLCGRMGPVRSIGKVLFISGLRLFPNQSGGHLRSGSFAKALARLGLDVRIYSLAGRSEDYSKPEHRLRIPLEAGLVEEVNLSLPMGVCQTVARRLGLPRLWQYPILASGIIPTSLREALVWADAIVCDLPYVPPIPGPWRSKPWLLLSHNLEYRLLEQSGWIDRRGFAPLVEGLEQSAPQRYDGIFACAAEDYEFFQAHNLQAKPVQLVPNGIDAAVYAPDPQLRKSTREELNLSSEDRLIVFAGSRYAPNLEALVELRAFARSHEAMLQSLKIKFLILGSMGPASKSENLIATGFVPSVLPYFQAADFALNPIKRGSGSNVKLFEYLAARLPVLSTEFGVRGTELVQGEDYQIFDWSTLAACLQNLSREKSPEEWRAKGEEVWQRHALRCDMTHIVRRQWELILKGLPQNSLRLISAQPKSLSHQSVE